MEEFDEEFREDTKESHETRPWYVDAINRLVELKEEAEEDLVCDVGYNSYDLRVNMTNPLYEESHFPARCKQKLETELETTNKMLHGEGRCTMEVWRCFSKVLEKMVKYVEEPKEIFG